MSDSEQMTTPNWTYFNQYILKVLSDKKVRPRQALKDEVLSISDLTEAQLSRTLASGGTAAENRVGWALSALTRAQLVERPDRAHFRITEEGLRYLQEHPGPISFRDLESIPAWDDYVPTRRGSNPTETRVESDESDPMERMLTASEDLQNAAAAELLTRLRRVSPEFFEKAVLELLAAMGYGGIEKNLDHTGGSGDGGIDGVLDQDALGLNRVHVQAKRYGEDNTIGRPDIQRFVGALGDKGASQGVFVTTSRFSREALETAERAREKIALIDGSRLVELMIKYRVGVQVKKVFEVVELDEDFFE